MMISRWQCVMAAWGLISLALYAGCDRAPPPVPTAPISPSGAAAKAMELFDTNKDGKISGAELDKAPGLKASLTILGTNKDQGVTADQIKARAQKWLDSKAARMRFTVVVLRNGQPLAGATVKLVPEKFLADYLTETPQGITSDSGSALISLPIIPGPNGAPSGMSPGIYRVEITKDGENIPAKYNTATELGQEVSKDNEALYYGTKYNLTY
jgi:hypothetical protein